MGGAESVAYAWQQQSLTDDAKMLFDLSRELYERFAVLGDRATKLGSAITKTVGAYNAFASSLESRVLVTARKLQRVDQSRIIEAVNMIAPEKPTSANSPPLKPTSSRCCEKGVLWVLWSKCCSGCCNAIWLCMGVYKSLMRLF